MDEHRYAVIGAGPSGLAAARALQKAGIAFDGYEASRGVGGLWDIGRRVVKPLGRCRAGRTRQHDDGRKDYGNRACDHVLHLY